MTTTYRVYEAKDGQARKYCGEYATEEAAIAAAESQPDGLPESLWDTARAAGHCGGLRAPDPATEEVLSWYGADGYHCVVRATRDDAQTGGDEMAQMILSSGVTEEVKLLGKADGMYHYYQLADGTVTRGYEDDGWLYQCSEDWMNSLSDEQRTQLGLFQAGEIEWPF